MRTEALGAEHPITASAIRELGRAYLESGRPAEALAQFERASAIWEGAVGHLHPYIGDLAMLRAREGVGIQDQVLSADHPSLASSRAMLANLQDTPESVAD